MAIDVAHSTGRIRRRLPAAAIGAAMVVAGWVAAGPVALAASAPIASSSITTENSCGTPAPGAVRCLAIERTDIAPMAAAPNVTPSGFGPSDLQSAYKLPSASAGGGQTVAIVDAYDDPNIESDLAVYRAQFGLPSCTSANGCFRKVNQNGQASPLADPNVQWSFEEALDVDMVSAACPNCKILLVEAASAFMHDLGPAINTAVALGAKFVSLSWGGAETSTELTSDAQYLAHPGVVITAGAGDGGTESFYPSSSRDVVSVGGTTLTRANNARGWTESAWSRGGSWCSAYEPAPSYQQGLSSCPNRASADISGVADPATGVAIYLTYGSYGWSVNGGVSATTPLIASAYALAGSRPATDNPGGDLYTHAGSLNDIVSGSNGSCAIHVICNAGAGWDGPTGLGTLNGIGALAAKGGQPMPIVSVTSPGNQITIVNAVISRPIQASDSAGLALTYSAANLPTGLAMNATTGVIAGTATKSGAWNVTVTATDPTGSQQTATFTWTVSSAPSAKVAITNPGSRSTVVRTATSLQIVATDSAGLPLSYRASLPTGLSINASTGLITGSASSVGSYQATVSAGDTSGASATATFTWTITGATTTPAKVTVSNPGNQSTAVNSAARVKIVATDSAGSALTFRASGLPVGLSIGSSTGLIAGSPSTVGQASVTISASDALGASGSATFSWSITKSTGGAIISLPSYKLTSTLLDPGTSITLTVPYGQDGLPKANVSEVQLHLVATSLFGSGNVYVGSSPTPAMTYASGNQPPPTTVTTSVGAGSITIENAGTGYLNIQVYLTGYRSN